MVSFVWFLRLVMSPIAAEAFVPHLNFGPPYKHAACFRSIKPLLMAVPNTSRSAFSNWRILTLPKEAGDCQEDLSVNLQHRAEWSPKEYQNSLNIYDKLMSCSDNYVAQGIRDALDRLDHAYRLYGPHAVICSFSGGKDAVVIFELMIAAHGNHYRQLQEPSNSQENVSISITRPRALYFEHKYEFPEVLSYLHRSVEYYDIDMIAFGNGIKLNEGLEVLVRNNIPSQSSVVFPVAIVLGTRVGDPNAGDLGYFSPSSHYMPPFMRVNPILDWSYGQVWHFLRLFHFGYPKLYDRGYTSIGTTKDTFPCPALALPGNYSSGSLPKYLPAYMLQDWSQERAGRIQLEKDDNRKHPRAPESTKSVTSSPSPAASRSIHESVDTTSSVLRSTDPIHPEGTASQRVAEEDHDDSDNASSNSAIKLVDDSAVACLGSCYSYASNHSLTQRIAGLLVIGDEILNGSTADTNTQAAARAFREKSVMLKRVVIVSDDVPGIVNEIRTMQHEVDVIVTSGGVGPTHDDVTIKSVAIALGLDMVLHEGMAKLLQEKMNKIGSSESVELTVAQQKMATLPSRAKLRYLTDNEDDWPVLQCRNIFILPGIPEVFSTKIDAVADCVASDRMEPSAVYKVVLSVDEAAIVSVLHSAVDEHPNVSFESYPVVSHPELNTVLTLEGQTSSHKRPPPLSREVFTKDQMDRHVKSALDYLLTNLPEGSILRVDKDDGLH